MHNQTNRQSHSSHHLDILLEFQNWWNTCPLFTRSLVFLCSLIALFALISDIALFLANIPEKTIGSFELTRFFFAPFTTHTIAELLFSFLAYLPMCAEYEKNSGTLKAAINFSVKNIEINILFIIICYLLTMLHPIFTSFSAYGLWGIFFVEIVDKSLSNQDEITKFLGTPIHIKTKYYPIALMILFSIISNVTRFDIVVASLVGLLHNNILNYYHNIIFNVRQIATWEVSLGLLWIKTLPNYVNLAEMPGLMDSFDQGTSSHDSRFPRGSPQKHQGGKIYGEVAPADVEDLAHDQERL